MKRLLTIVSVIFIGLFSQSVNAQTSVMYDGFTMPSDDGGMKTLYEPSIVTISGTLLSIQVSSKSLYYSIKTDWEEHTLDDGTKIDYIIARSESGDRTIVFIKKNKPSEITFLEPETGFFVTFFRL